MNSFIKLTDLIKDKSIMVNPSYIQSIHEQQNGSYLNMIFNGSTINVKETPDQILKKIDKQW